jgi:uncharacterized repeat protein (TIGR01451 family)
VPAANRRIARRCALLLALIALAAGLAALFAAAGRADDPDVGFTASGEPDTVTAGLVATYSFVATNSGPETLTHATLVDVLPAGATFVSAVASAGSCSETGGTVTCDLGSIGDDATATVAVSFEAPAAAFQNCGTLTFKEGGSDTDSSHLDTLGACDSTSVRAAGDPNFRGGCIAAGDTISTGSAVTSADPQNTSVTTSEGACITVAEVAASSASEACAPGFTCKTEISEILSPPCSMVEPCTVTLTFDGKTFGKIKNVFKDGQLVAPCADPAAAVPDPCLVSKTNLKGGDSQFVVRYGVDARMRGG